jgi:ABC-type Fe3+/spermidine/putrescine transport system ATPase subunit
VTAPVLLDIERLNLGVGAFALRDISLRLEAGAYGVLLGPTGCGKTLLAETLCGLNRPDSGRVIIGGIDATHLDPARRKIGYVPQDYALLPFRTVARNIALGLEARRMPAAEIERRVDRLLDMLELTALRERVPRHLSGGERQRTALGRALAIEPDLLILDEPLSAVDEATGDALIPKLAAWQRAFGTTTLHICHRLDEAFALASILVVMRDGRIEQCDPPDAVAARPANDFVTRFLRLPNRVPGEVRETPDGRWFHAGGHPLAPTDTPPGPACGLYPMASTAVGLTSPEDVPGVRVIVMTVVRSAFFGIRQGLALTGPFDLWMPGIYPPDEWREHRQVYLRFPETGWRILPET